MDGPDAPSNHVYLFRRVVTRNRRANGIRWGGSDVVAGLYCENSLNIAAEKSCVAAYLSTARSLYDRALADVQKYFSDKGSKKNIAAYVQATGHYRDLLCPDDKDIQFQDHAEGCRAAFDAQRVNDLQQITGHAYITGENEVSRHFLEMLGDNGSGLNLEEENGCSTKQGSHVTRRYSSSITWSGVRASCAKLCDSVDYCVAAVDKNYAGRRNQWLNPDIGEFGNDDAARNKFIETRVSMFHALDDYKHAYCSLVASAHEDVANIKELCGIAVDAAYFAMDGSPF